MTEPGSPAPARATPERVVVAVRDLFFRVKLEAALRRLGLPYVQASGPEDVLRQAAAPGAAAVVLDLADGALEPLRVLRELRGDPGLARLPVIGFAPHVDRELQTAAREAGCRIVVARSRIAAALPELRARALGSPPAAS